MGTLYQVLGLYGLLVIVTILIQVLAAVPQVGIDKLVGNREDMPTLTGAAFRLDVAQHNSVIAMALFAPAVIILQNAGVTGGNALLAAQIFLIARFFYVIIYWAGIPWARTLIWLVGFVMTLWLYLMPFTG